jgi:hypothetical protein
MDGIWNYKKGDNYELYQLEGFKAFFENNLFLKRQALAQAQTFKGYNLPGYEWTIEKLEEGVKAAEKNVEIVKQAIKDVSK